MPVTTYTIEDIRRLLANANGEERAALAEILGADLTGASGPREQAELLTRQLCWKYQTPLGYMTRDPSFDEIVVDVAKALKLGGLTRQVASCWEVLSRIMRSLLEQLLHGKPPAEQDAIMQEVLSPEDFARVREDYAEGPIDWGKLLAGTSLLSVKYFAGFATYKVAVIVANQAARVLLGRGLTLAANAALTRGISIVLGPVGWILLAWGINDLLGTSYKSVIPAVLFIDCVYERLKASGELPF